MPNLANKTADVNVVAKLFQELDIGDEVFREPARLVEFEHWIGHIPFAYWLTKVLTPCLLYTSPSPRDRQKSRMPSSA